MILTGLAGVLLAAAVVNRDQPARRRGGDEIRRRVRLRRHVILLGIVCGAAFLTEGGIENWSAIVMEQELDASPFVSALGPASYAFAMVVGRFSAMGDRPRARPQLLGGGALVSLAGLLVAAAAHGVPIAMVGFFLGGVGVSVAAPVAFSAAGRTVAESERGSSVATVTTIGYMGLLVGPALTGGTAELLGLRAAFVVLAGVMVVLAAMAPRVRLNPIP